MRSIFERLTLFALASTVAACSDADPVLSSVAVRDSAGVRIVEHAAHASPGQLWVVDLDAAVEFAMPDGDTPLFRVSNAIRLDDDRVVVADAGNGRILTFAPDGSLLGQLGRQGDGPGEFRSMLVMRPWLGDSLVVWDDRARRASVIAPDMTFARSFRLDVPEGIPFARVLGTYPDGSFLGMSFTNMNAPPQHGLQRAPIRLHHFGVGGEHLGVVGEAPGTELIMADPATGGSPFYPPHFYRSGNHLASEHLLLAPNDSWELTFSTPAGDTEQIVRWLKAPEPVTAEATQASLDRLLERIPETGHAAARAIAGELDIHTTMPAFDGVFYDRVGRVWLQAYDPAERPMVEWTVVGPEGELLATIVLPRSLALRDAGHDWMIARVLDDLEVEHVVLAQIM